MHFGIARNPFGFLSTLFGQPTNDSHGDGPVTCAQATAAVSAASMQTIL